MTSSTGHMVRVRPSDWLDNVFEEPVAIGFSVNCSRGVSTAR